MVRKRRFGWVIGIALLLAVAALLYQFVLPGLSVARNEPPRIEVMLATWLLRQSVPEAARLAVNPLGTLGGVVSATDWLVVVALIGPT